MWDEHHPVLFWLALAVILLALMIAAGYGCFGVQSPL